MKKIAVFFAVVLCVFANKQTALSLDIEKTHNKNSAAIIKKYINIIDKNAICQKIIAPIKSVLSMTMLNAQPKHKLRLAFGLEAEKNSYAAGETVSVRYLHFASDSNYSFHTDSDDVTLRHGTKKAWSFALKCPTMMCVFGSNQPTPWKTKIHRHQKKRLNTNHAQIMILSALGSVLNAVRKIKDAIAAIAVLKRYSVLFQAA